MGVTKTNGHFPIRLKMTNPLQEPPASSKAPSEDSKDIDVLCTIKIKIESPNMEQVVYKDQ